MVAAWHTPEVGDPVFDFTTPTGSKKDKKQPASQPVFDFTGGASVPKVEPRPVVKPASIGMGDLRAAEAAAPPSIPGALSNKDILKLVLERSPHIQLTRKIAPGAVKTDPRVEELYQQYPGLKDGYLPPLQKGQTLPYIGSMAFADLPLVLASYLTGGQAGVAAAGLRTAPKAGTLAPQATKGLTWSQREVARGAGAGVTYGATEAAIKGMEPSEALRHTASMGLLFGAGDVAVAGLGKYLSPLLPSRPTGALKGLDLTKPERKPIIPEPPKWERSGGTVETVQKFTPEQRTATREALAGEFGTVPELRDKTIPIDDRTFSNVGTRKVKAYQWENPEVKEFYQPEAQRLLGELRDTVKGQKFFGEDDFVTGTKRGTSPAIARILDETKATYKEVEDALLRIIKDEGLENQALAKKIELIIDDNLTYGTKAIDDMPIPPDETYLVWKGKNQKPSRELTDDEFFALLEGKPLPVKPESMPKQGATIDSLPFHERVALRTGARPPRQPIVSPRSGGMIEDLPPVMPKFVSQATPEYPGGHKPQRPPFIPEAPRVAQRETAVTQRVAMKIPGAQPPSPQAAPRLVTAGRVGYTLDDNKAVAEAALGGVDVATLKDIGSIKAQAFDIFRLFEEVLGGGAERIFKGLKTPARRLILDPLDRSKGQLSRWEEAQLGALRKSVVNKGIRMHSKESALLQRFGEKNISLDELKKQRPNDWNKFVEADDWFRKQYDDHIEAINAVYREVYGHDEKLLAEKLVPKRQDYYRHMQEIGDLYQQMQHLYSTQAEITPGLVRVTDYVRPRSKWLSIAQQRMGGKFTEDAVAGYLNYVRQAGYHLHITPHIGRLQEFGKLLAEKTGDTKNLNKFIEILTRHEQALAGKTHAIDRPVQEVVGRSAYRLANILNDRIRANMVVWSANTLVAQATHLPMAIAIGKAHAVPGLKNTIKSLLSRKGTPLHWADDPMQKSDFMRERYKEQIFRQFETKPIRKFVARGGQILEDFDRYSAAFTWHTMYQKGMGMGFQGQKLIKYADDATRAITAGRGIGERPYYQQAQLTQLVAPFQVEVNNIVLVHRDLWKGDKAGLMVLFAAAFLFNKFSEETRGSGLMPDPIMAITDALQELEDEDRTAGERVKRAGGRLAGEVIAALPFGQHIGASAIPDPHQRKEIFGRKDPTRYGTGLLLSKPWQDPRDFAAFLGLPAGGLQAKRTIGGIQSIMQEGAYTKGGDLMFPVEPTPGQIVKSAVFGKYSSPEAREYFDKNRRPLSKAQTTELKQKTARGEDPQKVYDQIMKLREVAALDRKINEARKEMEGNPQERDRLLQKVRRLEADKRELWKKR